MDIGVLDFQQELVNYLEIGVEHNQHASVSGWKLKFGMLKFFFFPIGELAYACSYLHHPIHGRVSSTTRDVGGNATYTCNSRFRLVGSSTRTCLTNGSWSGSQPICECMLHHSNCRLLKQLLLWLLLFLTQTPLKFYVPISINQVIVLCS